ncbi:uncharacterized protein DUF2796 [Pseudomonas sp. SJZ079]|uniref:DUF2796 domain-containing protein n=1 Tax=Pseudomonas sp. SJZ079 TaxID=2572887 RepID=UPI00119C7565|nr:DUF2796 domain-containing protein [Pseudomonas sp. SJZ079]TWC36242.1 uncharacterized protein DUF2796 [Pseudomonas sp. SJZ079]
MRRLLFTLPFALLPLSISHAQQHEHSEHTSLAAHAHGMAQLNVALDGSVLELELESPAINLLGFEHAANSPADRAKIASARRQLEQPQALFGLATGGCSLSTQELQSPLFGPEDHEKHEEHEDAGEHSEIHAHYRFACAQADAVQQLDLSELFKRFPATLKIQVQLLGPNGQQGAELTPDNPRLTF